MSKRSNRKAQANQRSVPQTNTDAPVEDDEDDFLEGPTPEDTPVVATNEAPETVEPVVEPVVETPKPVAKAPAKASKAKKAPETVEMLLRKDYWDENGKRHPKGSVCNISVAAAKVLNKAGKAERHDPLLQDD